MTRRRARCETCPLGKAKLSPELVTWAWFDLIVDKENGVLPHPENNEEVDCLLENAAAQAGEVLTPTEYHDDELVVKAMMECFVRRADGLCPITED